MPATRLSPHESGADIIFDVLGKFPESFKAIA
jgi:hypothetical protein